MKALILIVVGLTLVLPASGFAQSVDDLVAEAQRAFVSGHMDEAKDKFTQVLKLDPNNKTAESYMRMIKAHQPKSGGTGQLEKQLRGLILPKVEFRDATFSSALDYLKQQAAKQSVAVSIVVQPDVNKNDQVTLNLTSVPFTEALKYLCELVGATYTVETFAVVVKSKAPAPAAQPNLPAAPQGANSPQ